MSSASGRYVGGGEESIFLPPFHQHETQHGVVFHVPQNSRREKLRLEEPPAPTMATSSLPLPYQAASSPGSQSFYSQNPSYSMGMAHLVDGSSSLNQIPQQQGFSLTLSPPPLPPQLPAAVAVPIGPFTGYSAVLNRSSFLEPARQLLEEICDLGHAGAVAFSVAGDPAQMLFIDREMEGLASGSAAVGAEEQQWKKARLISMMNEVCRRYRLYYQQVQTVVTSFEAVAGLNTAAPYVSMALKSMCKHFRFLKNAISNQLHRINKALGKEGIDKAEILGFVSSSLCPEGRNSSSSSRQQHVWRPQRGLPERAVSVLRAWMFEHFLHPYPTDADKQILAKQTGLTRNQVSNWFINARVRLWKPMVEEVHNLEMRQVQVHKDTTTDKGEMPDKLSAASQPSSSTATSSSNRQPQISSIQRNQYSSSRPLMNTHELAYIPLHIEDPYNFVYNDLSSHGTGVSLTLGLHHNTSTICLPEPLPMNVARRFGLEDCNDSYVIGALEGQVGKDIGGHLLHDFVG